jgi:catechol 2,3-dioxygenase-like lactoylglutathione lyase family enzyme
MDGWAALSRPLAASVHEDREAGILARVGDGSGRVERLAYLTLYVDDLAASRRFYAELLGLPVSNERDWGLVLRAGDVELFLHPRGDSPSRQHLEMTFDVADVDAAIERLRRLGVPVPEEPADREWGDRDAAVTDPDSNTIYLRTRSSPPS